MACTTTSITSISPPPASRPSPARPARQPAEVVDRFSLGATDGPARYLKIRCQGGHWYTLPVDRVQSYGASSVDLAA